MNMETTEMYRKGTSGYKDVGYQYTEFCPKCGQNDYEDGLRGSTARKRRTKFYERHCPSCHCPPERRRIHSPPGRPRTSENIEAMLSQYERVEPISSNIKKSQSSPLSQKMMGFHDCQTNAISCRCLRKSPHSRRQRRPLERDKYPLRTKRDTINSKLNNEDLEVCPKYVQSIPVKTTYSSLRKHGCYRELEESPDEQEVSDAESETSARYVPRVRQFLSRKPRASSNLGTRQRRSNVVGGNEREYVSADTRNNENNDDDDDCRRNARDYQEMRKLVLELEELERLKRTDDVATTIANDKSDKQRIERRGLDVRINRQKNSGDAVSSYFVTTTRPSYALIDESIDKTTKDLALDEGSARFTKADNAAKTRVLESIDRMVGIMDNAKTDAPLQQEQQTEPETVEKIAQDLQENGWQLLFNALTIHRDATVNSGKRIVRLECLNQIRQQLDKLYALESTPDNCTPKQQQSSHDVTFNEDRSQQLPLDQKIVDS
ncbi:uncharacterized protein LOC109857693 [Pseudomyrmex gracilis]|uniref:uncharacterized protein LOC109857693 n=1 Tax=Pseudomyrmex gracilis TaxID=219809 RepID=UPI000995DAD4|nr:uncharacterized protein LOC109857693 [Pseudomyrmex gracilis]